MLLVNFNTQFFHSIKQNNTCGSQRNLIFFHIDSNLEKVRHVARLWVIFQEELFDKNTFKFEKQKSKENHLCQAEVCLYCKKETKSVAANNVLKNILLINKNVFQG
jgi:hypothetical protein